MDSIINVPYLIIIVVCVIFSAYFSATETAFMSLNKTKLKTMVEKGNKKAERTLKVADNYDKLISTILVGNNIVNILASSIATLFFVQILTNLDYGNANEMGATLSTIATTVIVLIFGEITPKSIARDLPEKFAMFSTPLISMFMVVLTPVNFIFSMWKKLVSKIFKLESDNKMTSEELLMIVEEGQQDGAIEEDEGDLLKNAIEFNEKTAEDILTHRVDLEGVPSDASKEDIAEVFTESGYSRILVYEESIDNIIGTIHRKDFYVGSGISRKPVKELIAPPFFIHKSEKINDLLKLLQNNKSHLAIVIDEYGGTLGIVTMEDILEELVGEIWDEHDEVTETFKELTEDTFIVDCSVNFSEFCDFFGLPAEIETDSVSLGGWIMEQVGKIPETGDSFTFENIDVEVTETDSHRVAYAKVVRRPEEDEEEESKDKDKEKDKDKDEQ
ncbi:MAG: HlyC/CorC family transporter [Ruminococcaceae bacterium]|nr:HlyC/CorC family transporter [Oscillospiraceae bacterium]